MERKCFLCGKNGANDPLERHHVFPGKNRHLSDVYGAVVDLCGNECHRNGQFSAHRNASVRLMLEKTFQRKIMDEYNMDTNDFIFVFGRNYLD